MICALGTSSTTPNPIITTAALRFTVSASMLTRWPNAVTETPSTANETVSPAASANGPSRLFWNAAAMTMGSSGSTHGLMRVSNPAT